MSTDEVINERRSDGNAHMWTTQEIERVAMLAAMKVANEVKYACEQERLKQADTWNKMRKVIALEERREARREKLRTTVIGQVVMVFGALFLYVGGWATKILWERLRDGH